MEMASTPARLVVLGLGVLLLNGCAILREFGPSVHAEAMGPGEYIAMKRGDILTADELSMATQQTLRVVGLDEGPCATTPSSPCMQALADVAGIAGERRLAALAELWTQQAIALTPADAEPVDDGQIAAWLEAARHAYAYLFFSGRAPGERAFEDRQTQVRDYYNYAVQRAASGMFVRWQRSQGIPPAAAGEAGAADRSGSANDLAPPPTLQIGGWTIHTDMSGIRMPDGVALPRELVPASALSFAGLRSIYRRDGFGAEVVAVMGTDPVTSPGVPATDAHDGDDDTAPRRRGPRPAAFSEMPSPALTLLIRFPGADADAVLAARELLISAHDPYREDAIDLHGLHVPLAANYTAGYGLWLARSGFARQSLQTLFGRESGITRPHLYMMQPYDPERRILLMIHGLASSPEAWVNVANEIMGDEALRREFQIWQVYYPTNMPLVLNHAAIRRIVGETRLHFDPAGTARASRDTVLVGHSMGGVLARLMVSSADDQLWGWAQANYGLDDGRLARAGPRIGRMLRFEPFPGVDRVVFIAAPHRGTTAAGSRLGRFIGRLVRLPLTVLEELAELAGGDGQPVPGEFVVPNSIDNLSADDPFVQAAADLPISPGVRYHSIIARADASLPLEMSDDGLVPYGSAHLAGARSEKVITSGHSVQETAAAILEIRRILHRDIGERGARP